MACIQHEAALPMAQHAVVHLWSDDVHDTEYVAVHSIEYKTALSMAQVLSSTQHSAHGTTCDNTRKYAVVHSLQYKAVVPMTQNIW